MKSTTFARRARLLARHPKLAALRAQKTLALLAETEQPRKRKVQASRQTRASNWIAFESSILLAPQMQLAWWDAITFVLVVTAFGGFFIRFGLFRAVYWVREVARPWAEGVVGLVMATP